MKLGPITIERTRAAQNVTPSPARPILQELGAPGTSITGGFLQQQDYNPDLTAPACYDIYDKMRLSDGQVGAALAVIKLPILRAHWAVEAASDKAEDRMIAEFCERDLRSMTTSFAATLRQIMLHLDYGSMPLEECWEVRDDGLVHLRKLAPRMPRTIVQWLVDENGGFAGIKQGAIKASGYTVASIPDGKIALFINEQEGANFRGISVLRRAYKHWYYKDGMYRIDAIANEKRTVGIDIGTIKPGAADKAALKPELERALMTLHAHEKNYIVEDEENYSYRLETGGARGNANAIMASIEHHDWHILRSVIAEFIGMGTGSTGSRAMHRDKTSFFLMALEATSDNIAETITSYLLKRWVGYNWRVKEYPRMKYSRLDTRDTVQIAEAVNKLVSVGALTPGQRTEDELRAVLDMPPEDEPYEPEPAFETTPLEEMQARQMASMRALVARGKAAETVDVPFRSEMATAIVGSIPSVSPARARVMSNLMADRLRLWLVEERDGAPSAAAEVRRALKAVS